ncbi:MAG: hypothetical protein GY822_11210 [Deltaproteobacteria bacterium]|nr:hypothetical protein [Deltaproteobacteria bacterium]
MAKPTFSDLAANPDRRVGFLLHLQLLLTGTSSIALKITLTLVTVCVFSDAALSVVDFAFEVAPTK